MQFKLAGRGEFNQGGIVFNELSPIRRTQGGIIPIFDGMTKKQRNSDSVLTKLSIGDLIIPTKYVKIVYDYLRENGLKIHGKKSKESMIAITMPKELVISNNKTIPKVIKFLKSKNIILPNT